MSDLTALTQLRERSLFATWPVRRRDRQTAAVDAIRQLISKVIAIGANPNGSDVRLAISACVRTFNALDDGWIATIEREDIAEAIFDVVRLAGFQCDDGWIADREW